MIASIRFFAGFIHYQLSNDIKYNQALKNILIFGVGESAIQLCNALQRSNHVNVAGFISDDKNLVGRKICNLPIFDKSNLNLMIKKNKISEILLAINNEGRRKRNIILKQLQKINIKVRTLPSYSDVIRRNLSFNEIQDLSVYDLLERDPVSPNQKTMKLDVEKKEYLLQGEQVQLAVNYVDK